MHSGEELATAAVVLVVVLDVAGRSDEDVAGAEVDDAAFGSGGFFDSLSLGKPLQPESTKPRYRARMKAATAPGRRISRNGSWAHSWGRARTESWLSASSIRRTRTVCRAGDEKAGSQIGAPRVSNSSDEGVRVS